MSKIKNGGLDQHGAEPFEQQQFRTAGVEEVKTSLLSDGFRADITIAIVTSRECGVVIRSVVSVCLSALFML